MKIFEETELWRCGSVGFSSDYVNLKDGPFYLRVEQ
jgi:hypothetical protein